MRKLPVAPLALLAVLSAACSSTSPGGGTSPPPPPPPPPPAAVASVAVTPSPASVEAGSTVQLAAQPRDASGNALSGRSVAWASEHPALATVDGSGLVTGIQPGNATITATVEGRTGSGTVQITAPPPIVIGQVQPANLVEGQTATLVGTGFASAVSENAVTIAGVAATITQASPTSLTVTVPTVCLPNGALAPIEVRIGGRVSNPVSASITPQAMLALTAGQQATVLSGGYRCFQLAASATPEKYLVGVQSTGLATDLTAVTIEADAAGTAGPVAPLPAVSAPRGWVPSLSDDEVRQLTRWRHHAAVTAAGYEAERETFQRLARSSGPAGAPALAPTVPGTVVEGNVLSVRVPVFGGTPCTQFETISAVVRGITPEAIFLEDQANPVALDPSFFVQAGAAFGPIYAIDVDHFGQPSDLDGNGRIAIVFTKEVNRVASPPLGFVSGGNFLLTSACGSSNEGELFYIRGPDPAGIHSAGAYPEADLLRDLSNLMAHEFAHVIQIARRRAVGGSFMASYLAEGLATAAQEVVGMQTLGLTANGNYGRTTVYATHGADPRRYFGYLGDLLAYFGFDFSGGVVAGAPEQCTWTGGTAPGTFPGPCSFAIRLGYGVSWTLIKQAIDRHLGGAAGQKAVFRAFSEYAGPAGYAELETVLGRPLATLMAEWAPMLYLDDRAPLVPAFQMANWNLRSVASAWNSPNAELRPRVRGFGDFGEDVTIRGGSTVFYELSGATRSALTLRVRTPGSRATPAGISLWVVRLP